MDRAAPGRGVPGVPNLTCIVASKSQDVIYPRLAASPNERAVLRDHVSAERRPTPGQRPRFIVADTKSAIWFTDVGPTPAIGRIDPNAKTIVEYELPAGSVPWNPAYDALHDLLWLTGQRKPTGAIAVLDPKTKAITEYTKGLIAAAIRRGSSSARAATSGSRTTTHPALSREASPSPAIGMLDGESHAIHDYQAGLVADSLPPEATVPTGEDVPVKETTFPFSGRCGTGPASAM
jgi:hypothetical protein